MDCFSKINVLSVLKTSLFRGNDFVLDIEFDVFSRQCNYSYYSYYLVCSVCLICLLCKFLGRIAQFGSLIFLSRSSPLNQFSFPYYTFL